MKKLTVFTPTYNRANLLERCYQSLQRQSCKDFLWLIIDDGSTDNTGILVREWEQKEKSFEIEYIYKENGGLYSGYITAINAIKTELCVCVDSDDYLTDNAIESILRFWKRCDQKNYAGIIGLNTLEDGTIIGERFPNEIKSINLIDTYLGKAIVKDVDWKNVVRTNLYKAAIFPDELTESFSDEKDFNPHFLHLKICEKYDFLTLNEVLCVIDYQPDGMTATVFKQYLRSPNSFRVMRLLELSYKNAPLKFRIKKSIHYVSSCILSKKPCIANSPQKLLTLLVYPIGILFTLFVIVKNKRMEK